MAIEIWAYPNILEIDCGFRTHEGALFADDFVFVTFHHSSQSALSHHPVWTHVGMISKLITYKSEAMNINLNDSALQNIKLQYSFP